MQLTAIKKTMATNLLVNVDNKKVNYSILIGSGLNLKILNQIPAKVAKIAIISDDNVVPLHANPLKQLLDNHGYQAIIIELKAGEGSKTREMKSYLEDKLFDLEFDRGGLVIALGGGVIGDLAGYLAATFMRGIPVIQMPTSLLAMVDSSVGGKTGVNTTYGKNLIGAFYPPKAVICDLDYLITLPHKEVINGFFEVIKIFLTLDLVKFKYLQANYTKLLNLDNEFLFTIIYNAVKLKAEIVQQDELEANLRMVLNFGHSIGHALEKLTNYKLAHGYAVGIGILVEAKIANLLGELTLTEFKLITQLLIGLLDSYLELINQFTPEVIINAMRNDKKNQAGKIKIILLNTIGGVKKNISQVAFEVEDEVIKEAIIHIKQLNIRD